LTSAKPEWKEFNDSVLETNALCVAHAFSFCVSYFHHNLHKEDSRKGQYMYIVKNLICFCCVSRYSESDIVRKCKHF